MCARNREIPDLTGPAVALRGTSSPPPSAGAVQGDATPDTSSVDRRTFFRVFGTGTLSMVAEVAEAAGIATALSRGTAAVAAMAGGIAGDPGAGAGRPAPGLRAGGERLEGATAPSSAAVTPSSAAANAGMPGDGSTVAPPPVAPSAWIPGDIATAAPSAWIPGDIATAVAARAADSPDYRSPFRLVGDQLYVLDQRVLPDQVEEVVCRNAADVCFHMRAMTARGGPLLAQLAAYGIALTARDVEDQRWRERRTALRRAKQALLLARPSARMVRSTLERLEATWLRFGADMHGSVTADALRHEADVLAMAAALDQATIARELADLLRRHADAAAQSPERRPLNVLVHGDPGALTSGTGGAALAAIGMLVGAGRPVRVWLTETRPQLEGLRLAAWELRLAGIDHTIVTDSAVAWLLEHEPVDAVLLGADWIASNGDAANVVGSRTVAELASLGLRDGRRPPVYVCAPIGTVDLGTPGGRAIPREDRAGCELSTYLAGLSVPAEHLLNPAVDVVPADRISAFITEEGVLRPPYGASLAASVAAREARQPPLQTPPLGPRPDRAPANAG